jgi:hypothetical protein
LWNRKALSLLLILSLVFSICLLFMPSFIPSTGATGESWLSGWGYRKSHLITHATDANSNYAIRITTYFATGSDSGENVYLNSKAQINFGDVRFTDDGGSALLYYWMQSELDSDNGVFWVKVAANLTAVDQTIFVYYGNSTVSTTSDLANTFVRTDNMEDYPTTYGWTGFGTNAKSSTQKYHGIYSAKISENAAASGFSKTPMATSYAVCNWVYLDSGCTSGKYTQLQDLVDATHGYYAMANIYDDAGTYKWGLYYYTGGDHWSYSANTLSLQTWYFVELLQTGKTIYLYVNGVQKHTVAMDQTMTTTRDYWGSLTGTQLSGIIYVDDFIVRKYVSPEPAHSTWGAQNTPISSNLVGLTSTSNNEVIILYANWTIPTANLSYCIFCWNLSTSMVNDSAVSISLGVTWTNITKTLDSTVSYIIDWLMYANSTDGSWGLTSNQYFTVSANITYYFDTGGGIRSVATDVSNGSTVQYSVTSLSLGALGSVNYALISWNWSDLSTGSSTSNPLTFNVCNRTTVWAHFQGVGAGFTYAIARFEFSPSNPGNTTQILFNGSQSYFTEAITDYSWNFGDGNTTSSAAQDWIRHAYGTDGAYNVTLTVSSTATNTSAMIFHLVNVTASGGTTVIAGPGGGSFGWGVILLILLIPGSLIAVVAIRRRR